MRIVAWCVLAALFVVACAGAETVEAEPQLAEVTAAPVVEPEAVEPTPEPAEPVPGRVALAAAEGRPHVLWFWGAH